MRGGRTNLLRDNNLAVSAIRCSPQALFRGKKQRGGVDFSDDIRARKTSLLIRHYSPGGVRVTAILS